MNVLEAALIFALLSLDHMAVGPFLLSRPVVVGTAVGFALGNGPLGFSAGLAMELLFISVPPMGTAVPLDLSLAGGLASFWAVTASPSRGAALFLSILLAVPTGWAMVRADRRLHRQNDRFGEWIMGHLTEGRERVLWKAFGLWAALSFLKSWAAFAIFAFAGAAAVDAALRWLPIRLLSALDRGADLLPAAAFASAFAYFWNRLKPARD